MAYRDQNGRITIDEIAAQQDIKRIQTAIGSLENARAAINSLIQQNSTAQGETASAINEKSHELQKQLNDMITSLNDTIVYIRNVVAFYRELDQKIKTMIEAQAATISGSSSSSKVSQHSTDALKSGIDNIIKKGFDYFGGTGNGKH